MTAWGDAIEIETRRRIKLSIWAYAYEFENRSIVSDGRYDVEALCVDLTVKTSRVDLDVFFMAYFTPDSGLWIHKHPELNKIKKIYERWYKDD